MADQIGSPGGRVPWWGPIDALREPQENTGVQWQLPIGRQEQGKGWCARGRPGRSHAGPTAGCHRAQELRGASVRQGGSRWKRRGGGSGGTRARDTQGEGDGDARRGGGWGCRAAGQQRPAAQPAHTAAQQGAQELQVEFDFEGYTLGHYTWLAPRYQVRFN